MGIPEQVRRSLIISMVFICVSCGVSARHYVILDRHLASGECGPALEYMNTRGKNYGSNARLLYMLDKGMVYLLCGRYRESAHILQKAGDLAGELWTVSISKEMATYFVSEHTRAYRGEDFERAMINIVSAVDYLLMGQPDEALVECRRLDEKLSLYNQKYGEKNVYKEDAFGRYLSGMIYESRGMLSDAYIDYRKAFETYMDYEVSYGTTVPAPLKHDLIRLAAKLGFSNDLAEYRETFGDIAVQDHRRTDSMGRIVLIQFDGRSPQKVQDKVFINTEVGPITLAFPRFERVPSGVGKGTLALTSANDGRYLQGETFLAENIERIAIKNLDDRKTRVITRTIVRAVAKQAIISAASRAATKDPSSQEAMHMVLNLANIFLEQADTRSWRTLPARIYLSSIFVDPGVYMASADVRGGHTNPLGLVEVKQGETIFLFLETMYK